MDMQKEGFTKLQLDVPNSLLRRIDRLVQDRVAKEKPLSPWQWLAETPEGRVFWSQNRHRTHLSQDEMNALCRQEWAKHTGGSRKGRPRLMQHRLDIITEALEAYLQPKDLAA